MTVAKNIIINSINIFSNINQGIVYEFAFFHAAITVNPIGLPMQIMILKQALLKTLLIDVLAESIQLIVTVEIEAHFTGIKAIFDGAYSAELATLTEVLPVLYEDELLNITDSKIVIELQLLFLEQLPQVEFGVRI